MKKYIKVISYVIYLLIITEIASRFMIKKILPEWEKTRQILAGESQPQPFQNCVSQAYLLYTPAPGFTNKDGLQHNMHGYRGRLIPVKRTPGVKRILCLGGSTTYGWKVASPDQSYPAYLEKILNEEGNQKYEVINAGIPWGTSAEHLTHYHFKFHFYDPDLVVINAGGNDAQGLVEPYYSPDYSHWRKSMVLPQPLSPFGRVFLKSRLISLLIVPMIHGVNPGSDTFIRPANLPPDAPWYPQREMFNNKDGTLSIPENEIAFKHNLVQLVNEIKLDKVKVLLVPFRPSPINKYSSKLLVAMSIEEALLKKISIEHSVFFAPYPLETISQKNWLDNCHNNAEGNDEKARYLAPFVKKILSSNAN